MEKTKAYISDRSTSSVGFECTGEYLLPDYNTDVKRVLHVGCRAVPSGGFVNGDNLELCGVVSYDVIYLDAEGEITTLDFCTDYDIKMKCDSDKYVDSLAKIDVSSYNIRLSGPRKISARASLQAAVHVLEELSCGPSGDTFELYEPEVASESVPVRGAVFSEHTEREYAEQLCQLDSVIADEVHILYSSCTVLKNTAKLVGGGMEHKGEMCAEALIRIEGQVPFKRSVIIPFCEVIPIEGAPTDGECGAQLTVTSVKCSPNPNDDGVGIAVSVITDSRAYSFFNRPLELISDCYLKGRATENEYLDFACNEHLGTVLAEEEVSVELPLSEGDGGDIRNFLMMTATPKVEDGRLADGMLTVVGQIRFSGIACRLSEDGAPEYSTVKYDVPFSINVNNNLQYNDGCRAECHACALSVDAAVDDKNVYLACVVGVTAQISREHRRRIVESSSTLEETFDIDDSVVTVYYPKAGDTLFDIAKRYHTSVDEIAMVNRLDETVFAAVRSSSALRGVSKLIIK